MSIPLIEIYVETGSNAGKAYPVDPGRQQLTLGRSEPGRAEVDISFSDIGGASQSLLVSRQHLCVRVRSDGVYAEDLDSRNGTEVDGRPLSPGVSAIVSTRRGVVVAASFVSRRGAEPQRGLGCRRRSP